MLSLGELTQFDTFGFIVLRGMLKADEVHAMNAEFDVGLAAAEREMQRSGIRGQMNWSNLRPETPFLASLLEDERFFGAARQILGEDTIGSASNANSFDGDRTEWHPDVKDARWRGIKFGCYLQPLDEYSGALRLVPGSHKDPLTPISKRSCSKSRWRDRTSDRASVSRRSRRTSPSPSPATWCSSTTTPGTGATVAPRAGECAP